MPESPSWLRKTTAIEIAPSDIPLADMLVERSFTPSGTGLMLRTETEVKKAKTTAQTVNAPLPPPPPPPSAVTPVTAPTTPKEEEVHVAKTITPPLVQAPPPAAAPQRVKKSVWTCFKDDMKVLFGPENWKLATAGIMLAAANQLTGLNAVTFYSTSIFAAVGLKGRVGVLVSALIIGGVSVIGNIIAILLIDRISRRTLVLGGLTMVNISNALICCTMWTVPQPYQEYVSIGLIALFVLSFQSSIGAAIWVCVNELFKDPFLKQIGSGIILGFLWTFSLALGLAFPPLISSIGIAGSFMIFSLIGVVCQAFLAFLMPFKALKPAPKLPLAGKKKVEKAPLQLSSAQTPKEDKPAVVPTPG